MIIRSSPRRQFTALPNAIFRDKRLSLDARAVLAYLLSLPPNWELRPPVICERLSPLKGRPLGRDRLYRIFDEMLAIGYMARSSNQSRDGETGRWGAFVYIVGSDPEAVKREANDHSVEFEPQSCLPDAATPYTANTDTDKERKENKNPNILTATPEFQYGDAAIAAAPEGHPKKEQVERSIASPRIAQRPEVIQARVAERLGPRGWAILQSLSASELDALTTQERRGCLGDHLLAQLRERDCYPAAFEGR